jgi:hypothetical protein
LDLLSDLLPDSKQMRNLRQQKISKIYEKMELQVTVPFKWKNVSPPQGVWFVSDIVAKLAAE